MTKCTFLDWEHAHPTPSKAHRTQDQHASSMPGIERNVKVQKKANPRCKSPFLGEDLRSATNLGEWVGIDRCKTYLCSVNEKELLRRVRVIGKMDKVVGRGLTEVNESLGCNVEAIDVTYILVESEFSIHLSSNSIRHVRRYTHWSKNPYLYFENLIFHKIHNFKKFSGLGPLFSHNSHFSNIQVRGISW